ncbi:hypothetical protein GF362_01190 [Candidatus Dojkabacteria bacterium]|nr:hypothetical protein [Candidatus Dojkabacteria bacterium]
MTQYNDQGWDDSKESYDGQDFEKPVDDYIADYEEDSDLYQSDPYVDDIYNDSYEYEEE